MSESKLEAEGNGQGLGLSTSVNSGPNYGSGDTMRRFITPGELSLRPTPITPQD